MREYNIFRLDGTCQLKCSVWSSFLQHSNSTFQRWVDDHVIRKWVTMYIEHCNTISITIQILWNFLRTHVFSVNRLMIASNVSFILRPWDHKCYEQKHTFNIPAFYQPCPCFLLIGVNLYVYESPPSIRPLYNIQLSCHQLRDICTSQ